MATRIDGDCSRNIAVDPTRIPSRSLSFRILSLSSDPGQSKHTCS
ncbi:hypothetical protein CCACVL1_25139 [Corchorus capsularis]|uniref:Uncharacterized protein n=1 Tax=Corchorus capsularis TaxID=210143 RepID=A0A1R3GLR9_COCAP|nr:hypothetical protein CCACVL1_25139 [Corchorus capsularis]